MTATRLRITELSERAEVSVDTIRFYQKRGLLAPPERDGRVGFYSEDHVQRLAEIRTLQDHGLPLAIIGTLDEEPGASPVRSALARARAAQSEAGLRLDDAAARTGIPAETIQAAVDAGLIGTRSGSSDHATVSETDLRALEAGAELLAAGVPLEALLELALQFDAVSREVATRAAELFDVYVRSAATDAAGGGDPSELLAAQFERLLDVSERLVGTHVRRALLDAAETRANEGTA
ncbi:MAG: MerR family transcriptional regulator [Acidimicrobiia bacterium]